MKQRAFTSNCPKQPHEPQHCEHYNTNHRCCFSLHIGSKAEGGNPWNHLAFPSAQTCRTTVQHPPSCTSASTWELQCGSTQFSENTKHVRWRRECHGKSQEMTMDTCHQLEVKCCLGGRREKGDCQTWWFYLKCFPNHSQCFFISSPVTHLMPNTRCKIQQ